MGRERGVDKGELIAAILDAELQMFLQVPAAQPARCQQSPDGFRLARGAMFEVWSERSLILYWGDLLGAQAEGRNLFTEKYARLDGLIRPLSTNPLIAEIVRVETGWLVEVRRKYPHVIGGAGGDSGGDSAALAAFAAYLASELETYSEATLASYHADLMEALDQGRNLVEEKYARMFQKLGHPSLDEAEEALSRPR